MKIEKQRIGGTLFKLSLITIVTTLLLTGAEDIPAGGDFVVEDDSKDFQLIYSKDYEAYSKTLKSELQSLFQLYGNSFGHKPERVYSILASSNDQINNGYATILPFNKFMLFNGGSGRIDYFSSPSWVKSLLSHEIAHTHQLSAQDSTSRSFSTVFGNSLFSPFVLPFVFPNATLPDFILEGNSIMNESTVGNGGRLYSGHHKAMFLALYPKIDKSRAINNHLSFPFMGEKYVVGSYFTLFLVNRDGIDKVNRFFKHHSIHNINPFLLNRSFKEYFGKSFDSLFEEFLLYYSEESRKFRLQNGEKIGSSEGLFNISKSKNGLYLIESKDFQQSTFFEYNGSKRVEKGIIDGSRIFDVNGEVLSTRSGYVGVNRLQYGLWSGENSFKKWSLSKNYFDYQDNKWLYFDVNSSFSRAKLFRDELFIDEVDSSPMFGKDGSVLYFKNSGDSRTLYRDGNKVTAFKGYYSKLVGEDSHGNIYFLASSTYGSTLFRTDDSGKIERVLKGDNLICGRLLNDNRAVLTAIESDMYSYIVVDLKSGWIERPHFSPLPIQKLSNIEAKKDNNSKEYREFSNLHYSQLSFAYSELYSNLNILFNDPVGWNSLSLMYQRDDRDNIFSIGYSNRKNYDINLNFGIGDRNSINIGTVIPLSMVGFTRSYLGADYLYEERKSPLFDDKIDSAVSLYYSNLYTKSFPYSLYLSKQSSYQFSYRNEDSSNNISGLYRWSRDIGGGFYLSAGGDIRADLSGNRGVMITDSQYENSRDRISLYLAGLQFDAQVNSLYGATFGVSKVFDFSFYSFSIPLSLRREAISLTHKAIAYEKESGSKFKDIQETAIETTLELLIGHKVAIPFNFSLRKNSQSGSSIQFGLEGVF